MFRFGVRNVTRKTYPALQYDFTPQTLVVEQNDYIHFQVFPSHRSPSQWTGSDTNAANQAGSGTDRTDRSNAVQILSPRMNRPLTPTEYAAATKLFSGADVDKFAYPGIANLAGCPSQASLLAANNNNIDAVEEDLTNCFYLNSAPGKSRPSVTPAAYFDGGLVPMQTLGTFQYMSTRNNNFSNRGHKGTILVVTRGSL